MNIAIRKLLANFRKWWIKSLRRALSDEKIAIKRWYIALYAPLAILLCYSSLFSSALKIFIATPLFILIPYFWGEAINFWCFPLACEKLNIPLKIFIRWILGTLLLLSLTYLLYILQKYNFNWFYWGSVGLATFFGLLFSFLKPAVYVKRSQITLVVVISVLAILPFAVIKYYSYFPLQRAGDNVFFARWAENFLQGELATPLYDIGNYLPVMPVLLALLSKAAHLLPIEAIWGVTVLTYIGLALGTYLLAYELVRNRTLALAAAGLIVWYRNSDMVVDLINYRPKILLLVVFVWSLYWFIKIWRKISIGERKLNMLGLIVVPAIVAYMMLSNTAYHFQYALIIIAAVVHGFILRKQAAQGFFLYLLLGLFWVINHNFSGTVTLMLISLMLFYWRLTSREFSIKDKTVSLLVTAAGILFIAHKMITGRAGLSLNGGIANFFHRLVVPSNQLLYNYSLYEKFGLIALTFSYGIPVLCAVGFIIALIRKRHDGGFAALMLVTVSMFVGYSLALPYIYRLADFMVFPITFFACYALYEIWQYLQKFKWKKFWTIILASTAVFYVIYFLMVPYVANARDNWFTTFTIHEYEAAKWLRESYGSNLVIITSPELAKVAAGITGSTWQYDIGSYIPGGSEKVCGLYYYYMVINYRQTPSDTPSMVVNGTKKTTNVLGSQQSLYFMSLASFEGEYTNKIEMSDADNIASVELFGFTNQTDKELLRSWNADELRHSIDGNQINLEFSNFSNATFDKTTTNYRTLAARPFLAYRLLTVTNEQEAVLTMRIIRKYYVTKQKPRTENLKFFVMVSDATTDWIAKKGNTNESLLYRSGVFSRFEGFKKFFNEEYFNVVYSDKRGGVYIFAPKF